MFWTGPGAPCRGRPLLDRRHLAREGLVPARGFVRLGLRDLAAHPEPEQREARVKLTYMIEGDGPKTRQPQTVPANSRASFNMADDIGARDASIKVDSQTSPVIPESARCTATTGGRATTLSGTTTPASNYYLAEGTTAWGFTTYVLVQNPNTAQTQRDRDLHDPDRPGGRRPGFEMPATHGRRSGSTTRCRPTRTSPRGARLPADHRRAGDVLGTGCRRGLPRLDRHDRRAHAFFLPDGQKTTDGRRARWSRTRTGRTPGSRYSG